MIGLSKVDLHVLFTSENVKSFETVTQPIDLGIHRYTKGAFAKKLFEKLHCASNGYKS